VRYKLKRPWTEEDIAQLRILAEANWTPLRIAARLKRTRNSVVARAGILGIKLKSAAEIRQQLRAAQD
jgi:GAF domain-containing protein